MPELPRLVEDLVPLVDQPVDAAVKSLQHIFGYPSKAGNSTAYEWRNAGVALKTEKGGRNSIEIYCDTADGFSAFKGELSTDTPIPEDRRAVRKSLGEPTAGRTNPRMSLNRLFGMQTQQVEFDRYENPDRVLHFEYDASRRVRRITLTAGEASG